jgi:hypothetical protein
MPASPHVSPHPLAAHLFALERMLLEPSTRSDVDALTSLLAEDFRECGSSGRIYTRKQIIDELAEESPRHITLSDPLCRQIADNVALLTYRSHRASLSITPGNTNPQTPTFDALRSSLWVHRDGRWQMVFHQGTPI